MHVVGEVTAPAIRQGDTLVLVCGSGKTPVSTSFATTAEAEGATLVVVTHKPESLLARTSDLLLTVPMDASVQFGGSVFEQACLVMFDALALRLGSGPDAQAAMWRRHTNLQ
ncbi:SIS domain-containing protein [Lichenifustis flavocetrariae]|uniref:SIS domain-containing protein n=1 Tax=Lichenifustis flavocetrariae TaxID=2949735 RepID=A0AA41Z316_9HYPH|nr:SIS domain-containing protein [Lichenifustis flavocetrariae]MCW6512082.1 SIS domain-containing protein [Lichenifustis flavocetrariae]